MNRKGKLIFPQKMEITSIFFFIMIFLPFSSCQKNCNSSEILYNNLCYPRCDTQNPLPSCIFCGNNCAECKTPDSINVSPQCLNCLNQTTQSKDVFYYNFTCVEECPSNYSYNFTNKTCVLCQLNVTFQDSLDRICLDCPIGCSDCGLTGCNTCRSDYNLYNNGRDCCLKSHEFFDPVSMKCQKCPDNCLSCDDSGQCLQCTAGYLNSNMGCCVEGYYYNSTTKTCNPCLSVCQACENNFSCLKCFDSWFQSNDGCCESAKFFDGIQLICQQCPKNCSNCINVDKCQKCIQGYNLNSGHCCGVGEFYNGNSCSSCSSGCASCNDEFECTNCVNGVLTNGFCCNSSQYYNNGLKSCKNCSDNQRCKVCLNGGANDCLECFDGYSLSNGVCCETGNFYNTSTQKCELCSANCSLCLNASYCQKCNTLFNLNLKDSYCCPSGTFFSAFDEKCINCSANCSFCYTSDKCNKCIDNFTLQNGGCIQQQNKTCYYVHDPKECLSKCPATYFSKNSQCFPCAYGCMACQINETFCSGCQIDFIFYQNTCLLTCPKGKYYNISTNQCENCQGDCSDCYGQEQNNCLSCKTGFYLKGTSCEILKDGQQQNLSFVIFPKEDFQIIIVMDQQIVAPYYLNRTQLFNLSVSGLNYSDYYSYDIKSVDNQTMIFSLQSQKSLNNPQIKLSFNQNCEKYVKNYENISFHCTNQSQTSIFPHYFVYPDSFSEQITLINDFFIVIFYIILSLMIISWLFNPRRDSLLWYMIDSFQITYFTLFIQLDFPLNLQTFLLKLNVFNLDFFLYLGRNRSEDGKISYFNLEIESPTFDLRSNNNVYKYLGSSDFLINAGWAFFLMIFLWSFYFSSKILLNAFRFRTFSDQENDKRSFLSMFDKVHRNTLFSLNLRLSYFFLNTILFSALIDFKYFRYNEGPISLILSILAIIYVIVVFVKSYQILNNPLIYNDYEQINHYLTLFKDVTVEDYLCRNHHLIIQAKKATNILIIVAFGDFPTVALSLLFVVQGISILRYVKNRPFQSVFINLISFITNVGTFSFIAGLLRLESVNEIIENGNLFIDQDNMHSLITIGFVCLSFIFMLNIIYLCVMMFIFFQTCVMNLDCICFFLIFEEKNEKSVELNEEALKEDLERESANEKKEKKIDRKAMGLSEKNEKLIHSFSNVKDSNKFI